MNNHFGVRIRCESMPALLQLFPQFLKVINLSVEDEPHGAVFIGQGRAGAGGKINNGEASLSKANVWRRVYAFVIRTTVHDTIAHRPDGGRLWDNIFIYQFSADSTHTSSIDIAQSSNVKIFILIIKSVYNA